MYLIEAALSILTFIENFLYKKSYFKNTQLNDYIVNGFKFLPEKINDLSELKVERERAHSDYATIYIVEKESIDKLIKTIFIKSHILKNLEKLVGFKLNINYFTYYKTKHVPEYLSHNQYFANLWHTDRLFTSNTMKLFVAVEDIGINNGPLMWINKRDTKKYITKEFIAEKDEEINIHKFIGAKGDCIIINSNQCKHKAGNPSEGYSRLMLMFQLNPSKISSYQADLYDKQFILEPNLPFLRNTFRKKILI
tara:strand:- start:179 stop:934 length:756 start_codon:yes stop_codon:yes gene_type:complete